MIELRRAHKVISPTLQLSFHCKLLLLLFFISDLDINIFAHLFQKCKDSLDLILGVFHPALCLIDVIQNRPVCKETVKEEICKFQKAVHRNLKVCGDLNIGKLSFEPPQFHLELFDLFLCIVQFLILGKIGHQTAAHYVPCAPALGIVEGFQNFIDRMQGGLSGVDSFQQLPFLDFQRGNTAFAFRNLLCGRVGRCFAQATGSDLALVSLSTWIPGNPTDQNHHGVAAKLYAKGITDYDLSVILPTGWNRTIQTVTLTGQQINDLLATGYDAYGNGKGYPYVLVSPVQPDAGKTYQVAICGVSDQLAAETTVTDSGVVGMDAAKAFFGAYTTISRADTAWS